ncbi:cell division protein ZapA [Alicyclobacillus tolerans]|uniref:cell division protein ZapA n=1 Tax=Alicyclobacillus tolerans TaxID=90970 RepID=UPI001EFFCD41|nr:cell division protein ZapA [Alicyclobacillus tolerans]MCF8565217.1 cell division protein ZapA [Alicyclobacillus tolerans]
MSDDSVNRIRVQIYGTEYALRGRESIEHLRAVAQYVDEVMRGIASTNPQLDQKRVAVLAAVNIADQLKKLSAQYEELLDLLDDKTNSTK